MEGGNPLIAGANASTTWFAGLGLVEDAIEVSNGIRDNSWVDTTLGAMSGSLDALAITVDPLGSLMAWGVGWLLEHVKPLQVALDWLAGDPAEITARSTAWLLPWARSPTRSRAPGCWSAWCGRSCAI